MKDVKKQNDNETNFKKRYKRYIDLAFQYHIAACSLWKSIVEAPYLFNPCMFLVRHTVELLLKGLIYRNRDTTLTIRIEDGRRKKVDSTHDLLLLWRCFLDEKKPTLFPTEEEIKRIEIAIKSVFIKDVDSTKYRYPETKKPISYLNLEPIKISKSSIVSPAISKRVPFVEFSPDGANIITVGTTSLKRGHDAFDLIEVLFHMAEQ